MRPLSSQGTARRTVLLAARARQHWLMALLLAAGLVLRVLVQVAYRPALFYIDSIKYLLGAYPGNDPPGYQLLIQPLMHIVNPAVAAAIQHLLGLAMAVALYLVLRRRGAPGWLSALAVAPVLLDGYQLQMEQLIMPDTGFEALVVAGLVLLLWNPRPRPWMVVAAGLALGACATFRQVGEILILPALLYALIVIPGWRRLSQALLLCAAFAVPILLASFKNYTSIGQFSLAPYAPSTIYGRVAEVADCGRLSLPSYERPLCPSASQKRLGPDGLDHDLQSPVKKYHPPPSMANHNVMTDFARQVILQQPGSVAGAIGGDALKLFALHRVTSPGDTPISRWQFQPEYPQHRPYITIHGGQVVFASRTPTGGGKVLGTGRQFGGGGPVVVKPLASFLRGYQLGGGYTPGPLLAFAALAGLAGSLSLLWRRVRRRAPVREAALGCLLTFTAGAAILLISDLFEFNWRYQLPAVITLPPAAGFAIAALLAALRARRTAAAPAGPGTAEPAEPAGTAEPAGPSRPLPVGGQALADGLEPGHGRQDDHGERDQDGQWQPARAGLGRRAAGRGPHDDGGQHAEAARPRLDLASGHEPGQEPGEGARQVGG
jgi:hypothetical protein